MDGPALRHRILGAMLDKLEDTRFPSTELFKRLDGIAARLPAESRD